MYANRIHLVYYFDRHAPMIYLISSVGDGYGVGPQNWHNDVQSASVGVPFQRQISSKGDLDTVRDEIRKLLDQENRDAVSWKWTRLFPRLDKDGEFDAGSDGPLDVVAELIRRSDAELFKSRLENGQEPEVTALCGGPEEAMAVYRCCKKMLGYTDAQHTCLLDQKAVVDRQRDLQAL